MKKAIASEVIPVKCVQSQQKHESHFQWCLTAEESQKMKLNDDDDERRTDKRQEGSKKTAAMTRRQTLPSRCLRAVVGEDTMVS